MRRPALSSHFVLPRFSTCAAFFTALLCLSACPGPEWPKCENDEHCKATKEGNEAGRDYMCVFGQCMECGKDEHCNDGERCSDGRCETFCSTDAQCGEGQRCNAQGDCVAKPVVEQKPECERDDDCSAGFSCQARKCQESLSAADPAIDEDDCARNVRVNFEFNLYDITNDARNTLTEFASCMAKHGDWQLTVEGHADERGTTQYNLDLGEKRAQAVRAYLAGLGVAKNRIRTLSYGEERPIEDDSSESAWATNRRAELQVR